MHNHHNFAWAEEHDGETYWVVRKGATPAFPGQRGFIGGSMGDDAVIVEGVDSEQSRAALYSTVHGAGRIMSRTAAKGKFVAGPDGKRIRQEGLVRHDEMMRWLHEKGVELRGGDLDEAPQAYRRLPEVLAAHGGTIRVLHTLRPLGRGDGGPRHQRPVQGLRNKEGGWVHPLAFLQANKEPSHHRVSRAAGICVSHESMQP